ncbi:hypothetical protein EHF_0438 [Ehrlichia japonica]|uniref:Uncharacterized protein n=1 Tax=Ehrlichia japonica TaxID=391036 RepID=X5H4R8_9RICK|nr:hypothetical protein EHF_0438 [Ehrlichia japonica]
MIFIGSKTFVVVNALYPLLTMLPKIIKSIPKEVVSAVIDRIDKIRSFLFFKDIREVMLRYFSSLPNLFRMFMLL